MARNSVVIGILMLAFWIIPLVGLMLGCVGLMMAFLSINTSSRSLFETDKKSGDSSTRNLEDKSMLRAGIFLNSLGLCLSILNLTVSIYIVSSGIIDPARLLDQLN
mgnify:CR=1 FL=1